MMVSVESQMLEIGTEAPFFSLPNVITDLEISLKSSCGKKGTLVFFISNHCPYVIHIRDQFKSVFDEYEPQGVAFIAISSNDIETYPIDAPDQMKELAEELNWHFPYCFDESQEVAKNYRAACTPDFFLFDHNLKLYYRGQFDSSRPKNNEPVTGQAIRDALNALLAGNEPPKNQMPSLGCNIKWKPGNEPDYFG